jgi:uracil-DNA glycosylase family 4
MDSWNGFLPENSIVMARKRSVRARLMFIGEGLGTHEDPASQLLDKMIDAMGISRGEVYITGTNPDEMAKQISLLGPEVIVTLGPVATQALLATETPLAQLRGTLAEYHGIKLMPTFHPSELLKNPASKKEVWADLQLVAKELGIEIPKRAEKA